MSIIADVEGMADKAEDWVEKEAGVFEHTVTTTTKEVVHRADAIYAKIDGWLQTLDSGLDTATRTAYAAAVAEIKKLF